MSALGFPMGGSASPYATHLLESRQAISTMAGNGTDLIYLSATCVYPISGMYTLFQRILLYIILGFIFTVRMHDWLTAGAIAYAMTYSSTAAIHGLALVFQKHSAQDFDLSAIQAVTAPSFVAAIVFLFWTPRFPYWRPRPLLTAWATLLGIAILSMVVRNFHLSSSFIASSRKTTCDSDWNCPNTCDSYTPPACRSASEAIVWIFGLWPTDDITILPTSNQSSVAEQSLINATTVTPYSADGTKSDHQYAMAYFKSIFYMALFTCTMQNFDVPPRSSRNVIFKWLLRDICALDKTTRRRDLLLVKCIRWVGGLWVVMKELVFVLHVVEFFFDVLVACISCCLPARKSEPESVLWETRYCYRPGRLRLVLSSAIAGIWYIWACCAYLSWIFVWIWVIVVKNKALKGLPEGESIRDVGQWGSWVGVALVLLAALASKATDEDLENRYTIWLGQDDSGQTSHSSSPSWLMSSLCQFAEKTVPWTRAVTIAEEWHDFKSWIRDPLKSSGICDTTAALILEKKHNFVVDLDEPKIFRKTSEVGWLNAFPGSPPKWNDDAEFVLGVTDEEHAASVLACYQMELNEIRLKTYVSRPKTVKEDGDGSGARKKEDGVVKDEDKREGLS